MPTFPSSPAIAPESFFWSLEAISRELRLPFSRSLLLQRFPPPYDVAAVQSAARALGARTRFEQVSIGEMRAAAGAWFALLHTGEQEAQGARPRDRESGEPPEGAMLRLARVERFESDRVILRENGADPFSLSLGQFDASYTGYALKTEPDAARNENALDIDAKPRRFGLAWFGRELLRYPGIWRDVLLASLFIQLIALLVPLLTQVVIDKVITHRTLNTLIVVAAALFFATAFSATLAWVRQYLVLHTGTRIDSILGAHVFEHLLRLPARYFEQRPTGVLVARLHAVETIRDFLAGAALTLLIDLPFMFLFAAIMYYYSPTLTAIAASILIALVAMSIAVTPLLRRRINRQFLSGARQQAFMTEYLAGIETVKSLQLEGRLQRRFGHLFADYLAAGFAARQLGNTFQTLAGALEQLLSLAILCVGAWLVLTTGDLTIGGLVAMQMFAGRLTGPMMRIVGLWQEFQQVHVCVRRLGDIMNVPPEPVVAAPARSTSGAGRLELSALGFRHDGRPWLFRDLSLALEPGQCVALTGASGTGKSTLSRMLQGFYLPGAGRITIDGIDITHMAANELRCYFGIVPQESRLFSGSVLQNLLDANPGATFEDAVEACKAAQVHAAIEAMPHGYLSVVGEMGSGLSGGQKQRLAIARALLKRPRILIFDEATASLDAELAGALIDTINGLRGRVSILFIAHERPATLECDRVVRLAVGGGGDA
jgi:ATP-binding cassette, subfamily B, bacterial HlyB/CyaB